MLVYKGMQGVIKVIKNKEMSLRKASKTYNVSKVSLKRRLKKLKQVGSGDDIADIHKNLLGRFYNILAETQEQELKLCTINLDKVFYGLTIMDMGMLVF